MTVKEILDSAKARMDKSIVVYQDAMAAIRAGRANPKVLDRITVDYYGTPTPLNQVGNVSVPEARMIVIKPWEKSLIKDYMDLSQGLIEGYITGDKNLEFGIRAGDMARLRTAELWFQCDK